MATQSRSHQTDGPFTHAPGWVAVLILTNLISYAFGWPFWVL